MINGMTRVIAVYFCICFFKRCYVVLFSLWSLRTLRKTRRRITDVMISLCRNSAPCVTTVTRQRPFDHGTKHFDRWASFVLALSLHNTLHTLITDKLQQALNAAADLMSNSGKYGRLNVDCHSCFMMTCSALHGSSTKLLWPLIDVLRTKHQQCRPLTVPPVHCSTFGTQAFASAHPTVWNHCPSLCFIQLWDQSSFDETLKRTCLLFNSAVKVFSHICSIQMGLYVLTLHTCSHIPSLFCCILHGCWSVRHNACYQVYCLLIVDMTTILGPAVEASKQRTLTTLLTYFQWRLYFTNMSYYCQAIMNMHVVSNF